MAYDIHDTICAVATADGGAARGIVRISGRNAVEIAAAMFRATDDRPLEELRNAAARPGRVQLPAFDDWGQPLPCDLFLWPTARSYTRQPVAELHTLGSPPLLQAILEAACQAGARLAEPGEFTLRAFLAGRIDLTQAEAVLGVIDAQGDDELRSSLAQLAGGLAQPLQQLREELLQLLAELEAGLDFVDEDIEFVEAEEVLARLHSASDLLAGIAQQMTSRLTATRAKRVALVGPPNVGKSSLFNALVARAAKPPDAEQAAVTRALVSQQPGTTRDYLAAIVDIGGLQFELIDTAGVDVPSIGYTVFPIKQEVSLDLSAVEAAAQLLAAQRRADAAIRLCCADASSISTPEVIDPVLDILVFTKSDLVRQPIPTRTGRSTRGGIRTSSRTGEGLDELCTAIRERLMHEAVGQNGHVVGTTADRCREGIYRAETALRRAIDLVHWREGEELVATELRSALSELGKVVGVVYTDDLLDRIFSSFCIGK